MHKQSHWQSFAVPGLAHDCVTVLQDKLSYRFKVPRLYLPSEGSLADLVGKV